MPASGEEQRPITQPEDLGFGAELTAQSVGRLVNKDGTFNVSHQRKSLVEALGYGNLLTVTWPTFFLLVLVAFVTINVLFGAAYLLCGSGALVQTGPSLHVGRVWQALIFSVDTFSTIGYGNVVPVGLAANLIVSIEAVAALLNAALIAGLVFARFSKPNIRIEFSERGVVRLANKPAVLIRLRNLTSNDLLEVEASLSAWFHDPGDPKQRRFYTLALERSKITFLPLSWTVAHFITPESPFYGQTAEQLRLSFGEVILQIRGIAQTGAQTVYARVSYANEDMVFGARFVNQYTHEQSSGRLGIDAKRFHATQSE